MRWTYRLALLGGAALVLATMQGGDGVVRDGAAVDTQAGGSLTDPVIEQAIRAVDFGEIDQSPDMCAEGLDGRALSRMDVIQMTGGDSGLIDPVQYTRLTVSPDVSYADLTGDGVENAVVHAICFYGANGTQHTLQIWDLNTPGSAGEPGIVAAITALPSEVTGPLPADIKGYTVSGGVIEVVWTSYTDDDPNCCPSLETRIRYRVIGDEAVPLGEPETMPAATSV
jgi:hypothetical protein